GVRQPRPGSRDRQRRDDRQRAGPVDGPARARHRAPGGGPGRQRDRGDGGDRGPLPAADDFRSRPGGPEAGVRRPARVPRAGLLPAGPATGLRAAVPRVRSARRRRPADQAGPGRGGHRRGAAVHHRSGHPVAAPGRADRQPWPAAGGERRPCAPASHRQPVRSRAAGRPRCCFGAPVQRHARVPGRAGAARRASTPGRGRTLASGRRPGRCRAGRVRSGSMSEPEARGAVDSAKPAPSATGKVAPPAVPRAGRQRRPTGAPPPLPHRITVSTTAWLALAAILVTGGVVASEQSPRRRAVDHADTWLLRQFAAARTPWLTHVANAINATGLDWAPFVGVAVVVLTIVFRRWRHLLVLLLGLFFLETAGDLIYYGLSRPR